MPRSTLTDLQKQIARLQAKARKLESAEAARKKEAVGQVLALMRKLGVSVADLKEGAPARASKAAPAKKGGGGARGPVPVKFRDPASGEGWSGRGRTPRWLQAYEAAGRSRDEFRVQE